MVIRTNMLALNAHRNMSLTTANQQKSSSRLSTGLKINSASDDAAGLAISEKMRAQIRGLDMASKNSQDAQSLIQTAEGAMSEITNMLQRVRELTVQAANDTNEHNGEGSGDRQKIQYEVNNLVSEIDSMSQRVEFNNKKLINGDLREIITDQTIMDNLATATANKQAAINNLNSIGENPTYLEFLTHETDYLDATLNDFMTNASDNVKKLEVKEIYDKFIDIFNKFKQAKGATEANNFKSLALDVEQEMQLYRTANMFAPDRFLIGDVSMAMTIEYNLMQFDEITDLLGA